jgi:signal peptidase I
MPQNTPGPVGADDATGWQAGPAMEPAAPSAAAPSAAEPSAAASSAAEPEWHDDREPVRQRAQEEASGPAARSDDGGSRRRRSGRWRGGALGWLREIGTIVVIALVLSFLIKTFLFRAYWIPSGSMENTLELNDRIFVNLLVPHPFALQRGDVVVFKDSQGWLPPTPAKTPGPFSWVKDGLTFVGLLPDDSEQHLVKRVIGMPGDRVICCDAVGKITVNGAALTEPYLYPGSPPADPAAPFDVTVPDGELWVMGDHRNESADSRAHQNTPGKGFVPISDVEGQATVIAWPLNRITFLGNYPDVFRPVPSPAPHSASSPSAVPTGR